MTVLVTTPRRRPGSHAFAVPVVSELPRQLAAAAGAGASTW